jgi:hypothetical protein
MYNLYGSFMCRMVPNRRLSSIGTGNFMMRLGRLATDVPTSVDWSLRKGSVLEMPLRPKIISYLANLRLGATIRAHRDLAQNPKGMTSQKIRRGSLVVAIGERVADLAAGASGYFRFHDPRISDISWAAAHC